MLSYILLFFIYAFMGWILEVFTQLFCNKKFVNRGFMMGPVVPIYAIGGMVITLFLQNYQGDYAVLFVMSVLLCGILEYFISFIMEKMFNLRWWDYSDEQYNINGRVCLKNIILFGILGVLVIEVFNPFFLNIINKINGNVTWILSMFFIFIFVMDLLISLNLTNNIKKVVKKAEKDSTEEISKLIEKQMRKNFALYRRIIKAYPKMKIQFKKIKKQFTDIMKNDTN